MSEPQLTREVLLIRPVRFMGNHETAASNRFQRVGNTHNAVEIQTAALHESALLATALRDAGMNVHAFDDTIEPHTPDSLFPNNWVSFHADGTVVLYPMLAPNRRLERRMDILEALVARDGFHVGRVVDLTYRELQGKYLEGTGSMVLDRAQHIAYACLSPRTDHDVLREFARQLDYELVVFSARDSAGIPIYHTNVMMCIGSRFAAVCAATLETGERNIVLEKLRAAGRKILELSFAQMSLFAGNMLELGDGQQAGIVVMSAAALGSLDARQRGLLRSLDLGLLAVPVPTIERLGGGSVRCMIAEIHLPRHDKSSPTFPAPAP